MELIGDLILATLAGLATVFLLAWFVNTSPRVRKTAGVVVGVFTAVILIGT